MFALVYKMEKEELKDTVRQIFTEYLRINGHRKTSERYAILDAIYSIKGHFDMETLHDQLLNQDHFRVSRATLYNTIEILLDAKLVIKHQFGHSSQYERCYKMDTHHHLICTECGQVTELQNDELQHVIASSPMKRFQMSHYSLYIYGTCRKCINAKKRKQLKKNQ